MLELIENGTAYLVHRNVLNAVQFNGVYMWFGYFFIQVIESIRRTR